VTTEVDVNVVWVCLILSALFAYVVHIVIRSRARIWMRFMMKIVGIDFELSTGKGGSTPAPPKVKDSGTSVSSPPGGKQQ
jgi:hypothetical protein